MILDADQTASAPACHGASDSAFPVGSLLLPDGITWAVLYARTLEIPRHSAAHGRFRFLLSLWRPARMGLALNQARDRGLICGLLELTPAGRQHIDHVLAQLTPGGTPS